MNGETACGQPQEQCDPERGNRPTLRTGYSGGVGQASPVIDGQIKIVTIQPAENGFIVIVGCKTFVAESWEKVNEGLELHYRDPKAAYKKYVTGGMI